MQSEQAKLNFFSSLEKAYLLAGFAIVGVAVMQQIGFVGLGSMGSVMAPLPTDSGYKVLGFDTATERPKINDVTAAASLTDIVACDTIITMLPDGAVVTDVATKLADAGFRGLFIDMSSSHPNGTAKLGEIEKKGVSLIDAPVSGGVEKAAAGTLTIMAGGGADDIFAARELMSCFGTMQHVGPLGAGRDEST